MIELIPKLILRKNRFVRHHDLFSNLSGLIFLRLEKLIFLAFQYAGFLAFSIPKEKHSLNVPPIQNIKKDMSIFLAIRGEKRQQEGNIKKNKGGSNYG